ncbi:hypothetical protein E2P64_07555 [Candidatus Bathyarchaeota archaeon]|nr:hypothetical protein E2P64_07555 [Candidatus Bathyarchaeota archaeon]
MKDRKKSQKKTMKRNQKEAIKKKARKQINREAMLAFNRMRRRARHTESVNLSHSQPILELSDEVSLPGCNGIGECCKNKIVRLNPGDIWKIMHCERMRNEFGIELTVDLFKPPEERGWLHYNLDPRAGIPVCTIRRDLQPNDVDHCAFLEVIDDEYRCILGDDRPMACMATPITRIGKKDKMGRLDGWQYVMMDDPCANCAKVKEEKLVMTVEDWLKQQGMEDRYRIADMYFGFQGWLARDVKAEEMKQLATMLVFDYDRYPMDIGGLSRKEVIEHRPAYSPEEVMTNARMVVSNIVKGISPDAKTGSGDSQGNAENGS